LLGRGKHQKILYIIDYGLAKRYRDPKSKQHIPYKDKKNLTGTGRYASLNTHLGIEQSRRDDLECLCYSMIYMAKGKLPWQGIRATDKQTKYHKIFLSKKGMAIEKLCEGLPAIFCDFMGYIRSLKFDDRPDYEQIKKWFWDQFRKERMNVHFEFDWNKLSIDIDTYFDKTASTNGSVKAGFEGKIEQTNILNEENKEANMNNSKESVNKQIKKKPSIMQKLIMQKLRGPSQDILKRQKTAPNKLSKNESSPELYINSQIKKLKAEFMKKAKEGSSDYDSDEIDEHSKF
jgi:hypothetical protein